MTIQSIDYCIQFYVSLDITPKNLRTVQKNVYLNKKKHERGEANECLNVYQRTAAAQVTVQLYSAVWNLLARMYIPVNLPSSLIGSWYFVLVHQNSFRFFRNIFVPSRKEDKCIDQKDKLEQEICYPELEYDDLLF